MDTHLPVLYQETLDALALKPGAVIFDGTFGRGGHARGILKAIGPTGHYLACDQDPEAIAYGQTHFGDDPRIHFFHARFDTLTTIVETAGMTPLDGVLLDLGVSSPQLDDPKRGFSFRLDGPLDMRMNPEQGLSAAQWLASASEREIREVLFALGEEPAAGRIAKAIVQSREEKPLTRTTELAALIQPIAKGTPQRHPATKSFQAIRLHINQELTILHQTLTQAMNTLKPGGRLAVISFHSLEDRIVKQFIRQHSESSIPKDVPIPEKDLKPPLKRIGKAIKASQDERNTNPRARSAVLRIAEKAE